MIDTGRVSPHTWARQRPRCCDLCGVLMSAGTESFRLSVRERSCGRWSRVRIFGRALCPRCWASLDAFLLAVSDGAAELPSPPAFRAPQRVSRGLTPDRSTPGPASPAAGLA